MKTSLKKISDTKVSITITVDAEELAIAEQVATVKLAKNVKVAGFRKGKTPAAVAAKNIDPMVLQETVLDNAISKAVADAFIESKLQVIDRPNVEVKKYVPGESLEFTAEAEILPEIKLGDYKKLKVKTEKVEVAQTEVNEIIERIQKSLSTKTEVKRKAEIGDEVIIDFIGKRDGVAFDGGTGTDYPLSLGSGQFIPGFEEGIVGYKPGETFDLNLEFPADYGVADLAGAKTVFTTTLKKIMAVTLPELNDEFAQKAGPFKTMTELTDDIKRELTHQKEHEVEDKIKEDLISQLVAGSKVPVPEILIDDQIHVIEQDFMNNLAYQGMTIDQYIQTRGFKTREEWLDGEVREAAIKRVKSGLVLAELSKIEKIEASTDELDARVESFKVQYGNNPEALKQFETPEVRRDIANRLLTEKTVERLVELNKK